MGADELCHCRGDQSRPRFSHSPCATPRAKSRTNTRSHSQCLNPRTRSKNFPVKSLKRSAALRISAVLSQRKPTPIGKQSPITCLYWRKTFCACLTTCRRREKCFPPSPRLPNKSDDILIEPLRKKYDSHRNDPRICLPSVAGKPLSGVARQCHERGHRRRRLEKDYRRHLPCAQQCRARQCGLSHDAQRDGILIQPLYREATALVKPVSTLCWQRKRIEPSAPRYGLFPNISVCLGERRGKKAISNSRERNVPAPALTQAHPQQRSHAMGSAKKRIESGW